MAYEIFVDKFHRFVLIVTHAQERILGFGDLTITHEGSFQLAGERPGAKISDVVKLAGGDRNLIQTIFVCSKFEQNVDVSYKNRKSKLKFDQKKLFCNHALFLVEVSGGGDAIHTVEDHEAGSVRGQLIFTKPCVENKLCNQRKKIRFIKTFNFGEQTWL